MKEGWEEINPKAKRVGRQWRRPYVVLRPREGKVYFSDGFAKEYLDGYNGVLVRYNRKMNVLSFLPSEDGEGSFKLSKRKTIGARNLFNTIKNEMKKRRAYFVRYNKEVKWLEICLNKSDEGDMEWLKA